MHGGLVCVYEVCVQACVCVHVCVHIERPEKVHWSLRDCWQWCLKRQKKAAQIQSCLFLYGRRNWVLQRGGNLPTHTAYKVKLPNAQMIPRTLNDWLTASSEKTVCICIEACWPGVSHLTCQNNGKCNWLQDCLLGAQALGTGGSAMRGLWTGSEDWDRIPGFSGPFSGL